jgi:hypothetical protein
MSGALWAHHSHRVEFDRSKTAEYRATITKLFWLNPHVSAEATVERTETWRFELGSPNALRQAGYSITAAPAKDGSARGHALRVTLADGRSVQLADKWDEMSDRLANQK